MTPKLPGLLVRYLQQKRCVVFVGAGLSAAAGLPTWSGLLRKGIEELVGSLPDSESYQKELLGLLERGKLLEVADFCKEKLGAAYHQFLAEQVRGDQAAVPAAHEVLMHLPFSAWVTTNYDKLLERAYSKVMGGYPKTLTHRDTEALGRLLFDGGQFILKAHGDIDRPETVVLTSRDYSEIIHSNPAFSEAFSGVLLTKALLFLGYSLSDPDFRLLMDRQLTHFKGFVPERYALMAGVGPVEQDVLWRTARIRVISYKNDSGTHAEVLEFLEALKAAVSPAPAAAPAAGVKMSGPPPADARPVQVLAHFSAAPQSASGKPNWVDQEPISFVAPQPAPPPAAWSPARTSAQAPGNPFPVRDDVGADLSLEDEPEATGQEFSAPLVPPPPVPHELFIERVGGRIQFRLDRKGASPVEWGVESEKLSKNLKLFGQYIPREAADALAATKSAPLLAPLVLHPSAELEHFPWESVSFLENPLCVERRLVRAPSRVSSQARGTPWLRPTPHVLLIEGVGVAGHGMREVDQLAALYPAGRFVCTVIKGAEATSPRLMAELLDAQGALPDLVHYTGTVGQLNGEPCLDLPRAMGLSEGDLRSVFSQGRLPFLIINASSSAFIPFLSSKAAFFEGRDAFMALADQTGVGAFVGTCGRLSPEAASTFAVALHRALIAGEPVASAVLTARKQTREKFPEDPTSLQYVLSGDGELQLWDSKRNPTAWIR